MNSCTVTQIHIIQREFTLLIARQTQRAKGIYSVYIRKGNLQNQGHSPRSEDPEKCLLDLDQEAHMFMGFLFG